MNYYRPINVWYGMVRYDTVALFDSLQSGINKRRSFLHLTLFIFVHMYVPYTYRHFTYVEIWKIFCWSMPWERTFDSASNAPLFEKFGRSVLEIIVCTYVKYLWKRICFPYFLKIQTYRTNFLKTTPKYRSDSYVF